MPFIGNQPTAVPLTGADIQDGTIGIADLSATGTKDSTTFLRGDNTFQAISSVVKKIHSFSFNTRTAGSNTVTDQFTFTTSFTPSDAVNNDLYIHCAIPTKGAGQNYTGVGLRFTGNSTSTNYDNFNKGLMRSFQTSYQSLLSFSFIISANTMTNQTYTVKLRSETGDSNESIYCPNSTDDARLATQTTATLIITEFKN